MTDTALATIVVTPNDIITPDDADWLDQLTDEVSSIVVEYGTTIRELLILAYWEVGQAIMEEIERQEREYDEALKRGEQRDPPATRNYIITHLEGPLAQHDGLIRTGRTTLFDATNWFLQYPTEAERDAILEKLAKVKGKALAWRDICRKLLPGHDVDRFRPTVIWRGEGRIFPGDGPMVVASFRPDKDLGLAAGTRVELVVSAIRYYDTS